MDTEITMYAAHKIVNKWLADEGVQKRIAPQMMYGYANKGYIESWESEVTGKIVTTEDYLATWYAEYRSPKKTVAGKKELAKMVVADNDGTIGEW